MKRALMSLFAAAFLAGSALLATAGCSRPADPGKAVFTQESSPRTMPPAGMGGMGAMGGAAGMGGMGAMGGAADGMGMPPPRAPAAPKDMDFSGIAKPDGGRTVAEVHAARKELAGQSVTFRGRVVKFTPAIMGRNWVHVQDGTGEGDARDLTITTLSDAAVGDKVLVTGRVAIDKDVGHGTPYAVIVEDATLTVEK